MMPTEPPALPRIAPMLVEVDQPCLTCGYSLKGLNSEMACPECGSPVERLLRGALLEFADPEYLGTLHLGAILIEVGAFAPIVAGAISLGVAGLMGVLRASPNGPAVSGQGFEFIGALLEFAGAFVALFGWWLFSRPDPALLGHDPGEKARRAVRVLVIVQVGGSLLKVASTLIPGFSRAAWQATVPAGGGTGPGGLPSGFWFFIIGALVLALVLALIHAAQNCLGMIYVMRLSERMPDLSLRGFAKTLAILNPILMTVGYLLCLGPIAAWIMTIVITDMCRRRLRDIRARVGVGAVGGTTAVPASGIVIHSTRDMFTRNEPGGAQGPTGTAQG